MCPLIPVLLVEALATGIRLNQITHLIPDDLEDTSKIAGYCQIFAGVGSVIGGYLSSYLTDLIGALLVVKIELVFFSVCCGLYILAVQTPSLLLTYLSSFLWGFILYCFVALVPVIISRHF